MEPVHDAHVDEDQLAADMREAFALGPDASGFEVDLRPPGMRGSSAGPGRFGDGSHLERSSRLGDFEILDELGRGGMGVVYRARQVSLDRQVALKVLPTFSRRGRAAIQRFRTEAMAAARLHHTNIVPVYAQGEDQGRFFYAMELVEGGSLDQAIRSRSRILSPSNPTLSALVATDHAHTAETQVLTPRSGSVESPAISPDVRTDLRSLRRTRADFIHLARLVAEVADGLHHAHEAGVIHRDIKPQNLLIGRDGALHITDFGLARLADGPAVTMSGEVMGTPAYLSPEQITADQGAIDHRTDVYSLGVTLYELLTLRRPFEGETRDQILTGIRTVEPAPPRQFDPHVPAELQTICLKAMEKDRTRRFANAHEMAEELRRFAEGRPIRSRPAGPIVKAAKWARRHRAATTAIVSLAIIAALVAGLSALASAKRKERADRVLAEARDKVVYLNYTSSDADALIANAEELGASPLETGILQSLRGIFDRHDRSARQHAVDRLEGLVRDNPTSAKAIYLLACALDRRGSGEGETSDKARSGQLIEQADAMGSDSAEAWFYRGLALHWENPDEAIESYENARALRLADGDVFLQATLQLARARNQRMYATRGIDDLSATVGALEQLVDYGVYGSYPYYLLSTTHRLAAEIYRGSEGTRADDDAVTEHFEAALEAARKGQGVEPDNPSPVSAEALCLESMGDLEGAIAAHTRSIELATNESGENSDYRERYCEAHHYRWRLNYWVGAFDAALHDIDVHRSCEAVADDTILYSHFYPALVYAEMGDLERAVAEAYAIAEEQPDSALHVIWTVTTLRILGRATDADDLLDARAGDVDFTIGLTSRQSPQWVAGLYDLAMGRIGENDLNKLAAGVDQPWRLEGESAFHAAALELGRGNRIAATKAFERSYRSFDSELRYTFCAKILLYQMRSDPTWPVWIPDIGLDFDGLDSVKP